MIKLENTIYIQVNIKETCKKLLEFKKQYNNSIPVEGREEITKKGKVIKKTKNMLTLKHQHIETAKELIRLFFCHLRTCEMAKLDPFTAFLVNNMQIAKKIGCEHKNSQDKTNTTIYRHIKRLQEAGIIKNKINHGSRSSYEIVLNPNMLITEKNEQFTQSLTRYFFIDYGRDLPAKIKDFINSITPTFSMACGEFAPPGCVASCNDIENYYKTLKTKISEGIAYGDDLFNLQEQTGIITGIKTIKEAQNVAPAAENSGPPIPASIVPQNVLNQLESIDNDKVEIAKSIKNLAENSEKRNVDKFVNMTWQLIYALLFFPFLHRKYSDEYVINCKYLIRLFYEPAGGSLKKLAELYNEFFLRCMFKRTSLFKHPNSFIVEPIKWLDSGNEYGFASTKNMYQAYTEQKRKKKDLYKNQRLVIDLWRQFYEHPNSQIYHKATQQLGKLKSSAYLDMFNQCVTDPQNAKQIMKEKFNCEIY